MIRCLLRRSGLVVLIALASVLPLAAQARSAKQIAQRAVIAGPATLEANMTSYGAWLRWPPVANATGYNVTRVSDGGTPETLISARASGTYAFEGNRCGDDSANPHCVYFDNQFRTSATNLKVTYRVYAIIPGPKGPITSPPSPSASLLWKCPNCPKVP